MNHRIRVLMVALLVSACVFSCRRDSREQLRSYYLEQTSERLRQLNELFPSDSAEFVYLHSEIAKIILVSKDTENQMAAVRMASRYFDEASTLYRIPRGDFADIVPGMDKLQIELQLRENELSLLNRILLERGADSNFIFTAH